MKKECRICLPVYKLAYSVLFPALLSLVRGISQTNHIGIVLDADIALLAIVFCADTLEMEYTGKRWEIIRLLPLSSRVRLVRRRLSVQLGYLFLLSVIGYGFFYWQKPRPYGLLSKAVLYAQYLFAVSVTIFFWGVLSQTLVNVFRNLWSGIGTSVAIWFFMNSKTGDELFGNWGMFSYVFRDMKNPENLGWLCGKGLELLLAVLMIVLIPRIIKKRD